MAAGHDIIVIGASAGGVEALKQLVSNLPGDFPAAVFIVLHVPAHGTSVLPSILSRAGKLPAVHAQDQQLIETGRIYVAPPGHHLLVKQGYVTIARGPHENGHCPAIDPLFRSAARAYGPRVIGVVLSGVLDDGTAGLLAVKMRGGLVAVQDPEDAMYAGMPQSALDNVDVDCVAPVSEMAAALVRLMNKPISEKVSPVSETMATEVNMAELDTEALQKPDRPGVPSGFACPACGGSLFEIHEEHLIRFRCRVGHAYGAETLLAEKHEALEDAFWIALRALEESAALSRRLAERARGRGHVRAAERFEELTQAAELRAKTIRDVLLQGTFNQGVNNIDTLEST